VLMVAGAKGVTPDQVNLVLFPLKGDPVPLGVPLTWALGTTTISTERPLGQDAIVATLKPYTSDPAAFRTAALAALTSLESVVESALQGGDFRVCDYGPSPGGGLPGPCLSRLPTAVEVTSHKRVFEAEIVRRRTVLGQTQVWTDLLQPLLPPL
jgi:hypothetical protein